MVAHLKGHLPPEKVAFSVIWVTNEQPKFYSSVTYNMWRISQWFLSQKSAMTYN